METHYILAGYYIFFTAFYIAGLNIRLLGMKNSNIDNGIFIFLLYFCIRKDRLIK